MTDDAKYLVHASYLEIYNEEIRDLLGKDAKQKLDLKEHPDKGVYVQGWFCLSSARTHFLMFVAFEIMAALIDASERNLPICLHFNLVKFICLFTLLYKFSSFHNFIEF